MGLFDRMGRVISSNFNALLDKAEDPGKSLELTLDEMRAQVRAARKEVVSAVAAEKQLRKRIEVLDQEVEKWASRAELAVRHSDDALARAALLEKRQVIADRDRVEAIRAEQRASAIEMRAELERMEKRVEELHMRKATLVAKAEQAKAGGGVEALGRTAPGSAFNEFRRMEDQIEAVETSVQAQAELEEALRGPRGLSTSEVETKFRQLEAGIGTTQAPPGEQSDVNEELQALKQRIRIAP